MTMPRKSFAAVPDRPHKSPLRVAAGSPPLATIGRPPAEMTGQQLRAMMTSEFGQWLRSRTNKEKRPFQEEMDGRHVLTWLGFCPGTPPPMM